MGFGTDFWLDYLGGGQWQLSVCCPSGRIGTARGDVERLRRVLQRADGLLPVWARASREQASTLAPPARAPLTEPATPSARALRKCSGIAPGVQGGRQETGS
jgi:hypothetical protein